MIDQDQPFLSEPSSRDHLPRYETRGILGRGAYGTVYAVLDRDLDRTVAIKVLDRRWASDPAEVAAFLDEARSAARIDHAAVVPVYDVQRQGVPWIVMKHMVCMTLEEALQRTPRPAALAKPRAIAMTVLRACEAIAAAHRLGTIHRDIKPANLLLGDHDEVWVTDWGLATRSVHQGTSINGTPAYMAPEQARGETPMPTWDVYALGVVLFEALYGRRPLPDQDQQFWDRKRSGSMDAPSGWRARPVPPPLQDIVARCLQAEPEHRYPDGDALVRDLQAFLSDEPVLAHRERWWGRLTRVARRHRRVLLVAGPLCCAVAILGGMLAYEQIRLRAHWGTPVATGEGAGWRTLRGGFQSLPDGLITTGAGPNERVLERPCEGGVALAYEASFDAAYPPGDISIALARDLRRSPDGDTLVDPIYAMVGAWDNTGTRIRIDGGGTTIAFDPYRLVPGKTHAVRIELDAGRVTVAIDGAVRCSAAVDALAGPRYVALYGINAGKCYRHLRVWERGGAALVPATAVGDAFLRSDPPQYQKAAQQYDRTADMLRGTAADDARFRQGIALALGGDDAAAAQAWRLIHDTDLAQRGWANGVRIAMAAGRGAGAWEAWRWVTDRTTPEAQVAWGSFLRHASQMPPAALTQALAGGSAMPDTRLVREALVDFAIHRGQWSEALRAAGSIQPQRAEALLHAGQAEQALAEPDTPPSVRIRALLQLGRYTEALAMEPGYPERRAVALIRLGRTAEVLTAAWADSPSRVRAGLALGMDAQIADNPSISSDLRCIALLHLGRYDDIRTVAPASSLAAFLAGDVDTIVRQAPGPVVLHQALVIQALRAHQVPPALTEPDAARPDDLLLCEVVVPALRAAAGDAQALTRLRQAAQDRRDARALRCAPIASAVLGLRPSTSLPAGDQALATALVAEGAGSPADRQRAWQAWLALPAAQRDPDDGIALLMLALERSR